jgi:O-antigen ligase
VTAYAERQLGIPPGTALIGGLIATAALGLMIVQQPFLAFAAVFALALGVAVLARPDLATAAVVFLVYTNAAAVAVRYHSMPYTIGIVIPALLVVPVAFYLYRKRPVIADLPMAAIFVFLLVQLASTLAAEDKAYAWGQVTPFILEGVAIYILVRNAVRTVEVLRLAVWALLLAGVFMSLVVIFQEVTATYSKPYMGFGQVGRDWFIGKSANPRLSGPIGDPNYFAQILLTLIPVGLLRVWGEKTMLARLLAAGATGVIAFALTLTFSRGAGVAFLVVLTMMTVFRYIRPYQFVTIIVGIFILLNFVPAYKERVATLGSITGGGVAEPESGADQSVQSRSTEMRAAGMVFLDHPLLGVGPGSFPLYYQEYAAKVGLEVHETTASGRRAGEEARRESHNMLLSIAADVGLFGLLSFLLFVGLTFRGLNRARKRWLVSHPEAANLATTMMLALAAYGICGLFLTLAFERYFWLLAALAGAGTALAVGDEEEKKSTETETAPSPLPVRAAVQSRSRRQRRPVEIRPRPDRRPIPRTQLPQRGQPRVQSETPILPPPVEELLPPVAAPEPRSVPRVPVVEIDLDVTLAEAAMGTIQLVEFPRSVRCPVCFGAGSIQKRPCEACEGVGRVVEPTVMRVFIPPRATEGQRVPIANPIPINGGGPVGHVVVRIQIPRRDRYIRYAASAGLLGGLAFLVFLLSY